MAYELETERLRVRIMRSTHRESFAAYRNNPEVAAYQGWDVPYRPVDARFLDDQDALTDLPTAQWVQLAIEHEEALVGDVAVQLDQTRQQAEVGYTLAREHWGNGYAAEAARAVVADLVDRVGVVRVFAELDPDNVSSQRVLESIGLVHETDTVKTYFWEKKQEWTDSMTYAATAEEWRGWRERPMGPPAEVNLIPIDAENQRRWRRVQTHWSQRRFVSPVEISYGDALFPTDEYGAPLVPVLLGIVADGEPAGFLMYADATESMSTPYLWRFLVDRRHQGRGIGRRAMDALGRRLGDEGHQRLVLTFSEGPGDPRRFYEGLGAQPTGKIVDGEVEAILTLRR